MNTKIPNFEYSERTASLNVDFEKKNELGKPPISGHTYISQVYEIMQKQNFYVQNWREIQKI